MKSFLRTPASSNASSNPHVLSSTLRFSGRSFLSSVAQKRLFRGVQRRGILVIGSDQVVLFLSDQRFEEMKSPQDLSQKLLGENLKELVLIFDLGGEFHQAEKIPPAVRPWERKSFLNQKLKSFNVPWAQSFQTGPHYGAYFGLKEEALEVLDPWIQQIKKSSLFLSGVFSWARLSRFLIPSESVKAWDLVVTKTPWSGVRLALFQGQHLLWTRLVPSVDALEAELSQIYSYLPRLGLSVEEGTPCGIGFDTLDNVLSEALKKRRQGEAHFSFPGGKSGLQTVLSEKDWGRFWSKSLFQVLSPKERLKALWPGRKKHISLIPPALKNRQKQQVAATLFRTSSWGMGCFFAVLALLNWGENRDLTPQVQETSSVRLEKVSLDSPQEFYHLWGQWLERAGSPLRSIQNIPAEVRRWGVIQKLEWSQSNQAKVQRRTRFSRRRGQGGALQISVKTNPLKIGQDKASKELQALFSKKFVVTSAPKQKRQNILSGLTKGESSGVRFHSNENRLDFSLLLKEEAQS
ncbi:MAG: hypothetical protein GY915_00325 [bacterium]|nr:hypothetical protein [bacterium]